MSSATDSFENGVKAHLTGDFQAALMWYSDAVQRAPSDYDALSHIGYVYLKLGRIEEAIECLNRSLGLQPSQPNALAELGRAHITTGNYVESVKACEQALLIDPHCLPALLTLSQARGLLGDGEAELRILRYSEATFPESLMVKFCFAQLYYRQQNFTEALRCFNCCLADPSLVNDSNFNIALCLFQMGSFNEASQYLDLVDFRSVDPDQFINLRIEILVSQQKFNEALFFLDSFRDNIRLRDSVLITRAHIHASAGDLPKAVDEFLKVSTETLERQDHYLKLGVLCEKLKLFGLSESLLSKHLEVNPSDVFCLDLLGHVLFHTNRVEQAIIQCKKALDLDHNYWLAFYNMGVYLSSICDDAGAIECYRKAYSINPSSIESAVNLSLCYLRLGNFIEGWPYYEFRHRRKDFISSRKRVLSNSLLECDVYNFSGFVILIHAEQGFGDSIFYSRYLKLIIQEGASIVLEIQPSLVDLMRSQFPTLNIIPAGEKLPHYDYNCPLPSLPYYFVKKLGREVFPPLRMESPIDKSVKWYRILGPRTRKRCGICWRGNPNFARDSDRSITLDDLRETISLFKDIEFVFVGNQLPAQDLREARDLGIRLFLEDINCFSDTAGLISNIDFIISVDTSVAHLAGALSKPTFILISSNPDFRWRLDSAKTAWYPSVTLIRNKRSDSWITTLRNARPKLFEVLS